VTARPGMAWIGAALRLGLGLRLAGLYRQAPGLPQNWLQHWPRTPPPHGEAHVQEPLRSNRVPSGRRPPGPATLPVDSYWFRWFAILNAGQCHTLMVVALRSATVSLSLSVAGLGGVRALLLQLERRPSSPGLRVRPRYLAR
jgi:hypothetical protein